MENIMKYLASFLFGFLFLAAAYDLAAQDPIDRQAIFAHGISLEYGIGLSAQTDEYISKEKYSGNLKPVFSKHHHGLDRIIAVNEPF
jgi:hypothetical protein